jgi:hypothetical protein
VGIISGKQVDTDFEALQLLPHGTGNPDLDGTDILGTQVQVLRHLLRLPPLDYIQIESPKSFGSHTRFGACDRFGEQALTLPLAERPQATVSWVGDPFRRARPVG